MKNLCLVLAALVAACTPAPVEPDELDPATDLGACQLTCKPVDLQLWLNHDQLPLAVGVWGAPDATCQAGETQADTTCTEVRTVSCAECQQLVRDLECEDVVVQDDIPVTLAGGHTDVEPACQ